MTALLARKDISHLHCLLLLWPHLVFPFLLVGLDQVVEGLANPQTHININLKPVTPAFVMHLIEHK